jgi:formate/nitrite transporter FocA (FNT family)
MEGSEQVPVDDPPGAGGEQKSSTTILAQAIEGALSQFERPRTGLFLSGLSAGLDIGFGPLLMAVVLTLLGPESGGPVREFVLANAYAVGFIFVILGRSELFTEQTALAVLPVLDGRASVADLGGLWATVYAANVLGGTAFALIAVFGAPAYGIAEPFAFAQIAEKLTDHSILGQFVAAVFAGWLMGLLAWLVVAAQETTSRLLVVWLVTVTIGMGHLPHSIAGNVEVVAGIFTSDSITVLDYLRFLVLSTAGNAVGGAFFVGLLKYGHVVRGGE